MYMFKYVTKRLGLMLFTFLIIFTMCFVLIKLLPIPTNALPGQDPEIIMRTLEGRGWITNIQEGENGVWTYDRVPIFIQFGTYIKRIVTRGDFGIVTTYGEYLNMNIWKVFVSHLPPTILINIYSTLIGVPIGLLTAVYLAKMAPKKVKAVMGQAVSLLAGIPSVVYGLVGMVVLVPGVRKLFHIPDGASLFSAIIVLAVMILPSIIKMSVTALEAVPKEYEDASLALGATPEETWFRISVPAARSGIAAAVVLGVGRAIGEATAVMMVAGNVANMPDSLFQSVQFLTTAVVTNMSYSSGLYRQALFSIALVLFLFIMLINAVLNFFLKGERSK